LGHFVFLLLRRQQKFQYPVAVGGLLNPLPEFGLAMGLMPFAAEWD
jgi:hypothetical protein